MQSCEATLLSSITDNFTAAPEYFRSCEGKNILARLFFQGRIRFYMRLYFTSDIRFEVEAISMADAKRQQPPMKIERTIGSTTFIVTSNFQEHGNTAVDKIRCLIDVNAKEKKPCRKD